MKNPRVTVLMSVYNGESYLREAVDSILNQTFKDFEFIIINDASTDETYEILNSYSDPRIRIHTNKKNLGVAKSLNVGLKISKGNYIARQDADDISTPDRLAIEVAFLDSHPDYAVVGTFPRVIYENSGKIRYGKRPVKDIEIRRALKTKNCIVHGSVMIRMKCLLDVGLYDESMANSEDYELWLRLSKKYSFKNIEKFLYVLRLHDKNLETGYMVEQQIFVALAKVKNNSSNIKDSAEYFLDTIEKRYFVASKIKSILERIDKLTFNRIRSYRILQMIYKIRFSRSITKILRNFKSGRIDSKNAKLNIEKVLDANLLNWTAIFLPIIKNK